MTYSVLSKQKSVNIHVLKTSYVGYMGHFMGLPEISAVSVTCNTDRIVSAFASQCVQNIVSCKSENALV